MNASGRRVSRLGGCGSVWLIPSQSRTPQNSSQISCRILPGAGAYLLNAGAKQVPESRSSYSR